jgi:hypothetical protein
VGFATHWVAPKVSPLMFSSLASSFSRLFLARRTAGSRQVSAAAL